LIEEPTSCEPDRVSAAISGRGSTIGALIASDVSKHEAIARLRQAGAVDHSAGLREATAVVSGRADS